MGISRYNKRFEYKNKNFSYMFSNIFKKRGQRAIVQYSTAELKYPTAAQIEQLQIVSVIWKAGQKYFKLAEQYYGDPQYWWIIGWYNGKPLEVDIRAGQIIQVPTPLELILEYLDII